MHRALRIAGFGMLVAATAVGSGVKQVVHETAEVSLVEVPVNVVDRAGKPVAGLTAADFEITDEGKPQTITALDVVDLNRKDLVPGLPSELPAAARRHFLFLFDLSFATGQEVVRSREAAIHFVEQAMAPEDFAAVATDSVETGVSLLLTFTPDRRQIVSALRGVGLPTDTDRARDPLGFAFSMPGDPVTGVNGSDVEEYKPNATAVDPSSATRLYAMMARKSADDFSVTRVQRHLGGMGILAAALDAIEGRKTIVFFSEGYDGRLLVGELAQERSSEQTRAENDAIASGFAWTIDVDRRYANAPLQRQMSDTIDLLKRSDCIVYPIDIAGLKAEGDVSLGTTTRGEAALFEFAKETGGELIKSANDLNVQMQRIAERTSLTYVLSFRPTLTLGDGQFHNLKVRVKQKAVKVSARAGYYENKGFRAMSPLERMLSAADVITHEKKDSDFPVSVLAVPFAGDRIARVPVLLSVPGKSLAAMDPKSRLELGIYVYVTDEAGRLADFFTRTVAMDSAGQTERLAQGGFLYYGLCRLLPGKYRVRAYVRSESDGRYGFTVVPVDVPEFSAGAIQALPPVFVDEGEPGLRLKDSSAKSEKEAEPFQVGEASFVPQTEPTLAPGTHARLCLMLYRKTQSGSLPPFEIETQVLDAEGHSHGAARISLIGRSVPDAEGLVKVLVDFAAPELGPGHYSLRVLFRDSQDHAVQSEGEAKFRIS
jgi:VWFA-related protein